MATKMTYGEQLLHPNWQKKRLGMLEAAGWSCTCCGSTTVTLHVHHKRYIKGRMAWEYEDSQLDVLCANCHKDEHDQRELLDRLLAESDMGGAALSMVVGLVAGFLDACVAVDPELAQQGFKHDANSYDAGVMAALSLGADWTKMSAAARIVAPPSLSPAEQSVMSRWSGA